MSIGRIAWWLALVILVLACTATVALTVRSHKAGWQNIGDYLVATRSQVDQPQMTDVASEADFEGRFLLKNLYINHKLVDDGIALIVILFSCLATFLLATCLIERRRKSQPNSR